jgi:hypothetical protein
MLTILKIFFLLLFGHALADYPFQGDFLSKAKNHLKPVAGVPWWLALLTHGIIHGGMVLLVTMSLPLALTEVIYHTLIDYGKCDKRYGLAADQAMHVVCKLVYVVALSSVLG